MKLEAGVTVFDDDAPDTLKGQSGRDWFFADLDGQDSDDDVIEDLKVDEFVEFLL